MSKRKHIKNPWVLKRQKETAKPKQFLMSPDAVTSQRMNPHEKIINEKVGMAVRAHILPLKTLIDRRFRHVENLEANQIALQTVLMKHQIITKEEFAKEYENVVRDLYGVVDDMGIMSGFVKIEMYNIQMSSGGVI